MAGTTSGKYSQVMAFARSSSVSAARPNAGSPRLSRMSRVMPTRQWVVIVGLSPSRACVAQHVETAAQGGLQQELIEAESEEPKAFGRIFSRPGLIRRDKRRRLALLLTCGHDAIDRGEIARFLKSARHA